MLRVFWLLYPKLLCHRGCRQSNPAGSRAVCGLRGEMGAGFTDRPTYRSCFRCKYQVSIDRIQSRMIDLDAGSYCKASQSPKCEKLRPSASLTTKIHNIVGHVRVVRDYKIWYVTLFKDVSRDF